MNDKIICPVCGKYEFAEKKDYDICNFCGWENDGYYEAGGANRISLDDYIFRYKQYVEDNPDYMWSSCGYPDINPED